MGSVRPRATLPSEFAVFPLEGAMLLPRGRLPLNIFEPRYLAMVEDALGAGRLFGMIQPDSAAPPGATGPALFRVGCLGRISQFSETEDGRFLITLTGVIRFEVQEELAPRRGYRRVRAAFDRFVCDLRADPEPIGLPRESILGALRTYFARRALEANWEVIGRLPDETLVVTLAMSCPFSPAEKQAILEAGGEAARAAALLALLQMGAAEEPPGRAVS
ncbi:MAG TPA: LON peptidase substrate-binding domain-containing protein [Acetobacteraceae bacterium]|nr:LON peptidase substrate-binding domain-containing protein [Acetobacteraceae bacterium]